MKILSQRRAGTDVAFTKLRLPRAQVLGEQIPGIGIEAKLRHWQMIACLAGPGSGSAYTMLALFWQRRFSLARFTGGILDDHLVLQLFKHFQQPGLPKLRARREAHFRPGDLNILAQG